MTDPLLQSQNIKIKKLVGDYRSGHLVIPEFQRDYVWKKSKAPRLIDSLYRQYPISSLLLWQSTDNTRERRRSPRPARTGQVSWLIDGQQRIITLSRVLNGDEGIDVVFHPEKDEFRLANAATKNDPNWYGVADILDDKSYRDIRRNLESSRRGDMREAKFDKLRQLLDYEVSIVRMVGHPFLDAVDAFKRINTLGIRLKVEDIESATVAAKHSGFIADEVAPFLDEIRSKGFSRLNVMHLFRACAFVAKPDGRTRTPFHELSESEVKLSWSKTRRATEKTLNLVQSELGLVNMDILWSGALLVPVIVLCATTPPKDLEVDALIGWMTLAGLLHRYSGASETKLDQDLRACRNPDPIGALLANLREIRAPLRAKENDFRTSIADRNALFAMYVACRHRGIRDFFTGGKILMQSTIDRHHILPRGQFGKEKRTIADNISNTAFITADVNKAISLSGPEVYLKNIDKNVLYSQCIPEDRQLWSIESAQRFWSARAKLLANSFNEYLKLSFPTRRGLG